MFTSGRSICSSRTIVLTTRSGIIKEVWSCIDSIALQPPGTVQVHLNVGQFVDGSPNPDFSVKILVTPEDVALSVETGETGQLADCGDAVDRYDFENEWVMTIGKPIRKTPG